MALVFDAKNNFAYSTVNIAPSPAASGTSLTVGGGDGAKFPAVPFNVTVWPSGVQPTTANAEIMRVTNIAGDVFTVTRAQEGTAARTVLVGDQIAQTVTAKTLTDIEQQLADLADIIAPIGSGKLWFSESAPAETSWLLCNGQAVSRTTYSELFALWGTTFGSGDGSTTFNIPDLRGKIPIGQGTTGALATFASALGSWDHTHGPGSLTVASHTHGPGTLTVASHTHGPGTLAVASHSHGPGTLTVASHSHTLSNHTHSMQSHTHSMQGHTHGAGTLVTGGPSATVLADNDGLENVVAAHQSHTHSLSGNTGGPSVASTGAPSVASTGTPSDNSSGNTAPAVNAGLTGTSAPAVSSGVTAATAPVVNAGATAATAPAVSAGVTGANNPPVLVINFIVKAKSGVF